MSRAPDTHIRVHDGMPDHPKVAGLDDDAAAWLLVALWAYCSRHSTDGRVPKPAAHRLTKSASRTRCVKLVRAGLLHEDGDSYVCHDYLAWQRSAAEVAAMREQRRLAGQAGGRAKGKRAVSDPPASRHTLATPGAVQTETETETEVLHLASLASSTDPGDESSDVDVDAPRTTSAAR